MKKEQARRLERASKRTFGLTFISSAAREGFRRNLRQLVALEEMKNRTAVTQAEVLWELVNRELTRAR